MSWRDDDDDERPDWQEAEPEEEKSDRGGVLGGTAPVAKLVFVAILVALVVTTIVTLTGGLQRWFGG